MTRVVGSRLSSVNRRQFLTATGFAVGTAMLTGCGPATSGAGAESGTPGNGYPVTIQAAEGAVTIPAMPTRVVSIGQYRDTDAAVALGVFPMATPDLSRFIPGGISPWLKAKLGGRRPPTLLPNDNSVPFEQIASVRPDLILATDNSTLAKTYRQLSRIAPTLSTQNGYNKDPWQLTTNRVAKALGREQQAGSVVSQVEAMVRAVRAQHPGFAGKTFTIGPVTAQGVVNTISRTTDASAAFMSQLGLRLSPAVTNLPQGSFPGRAIIGPERLDLLDADVLILTFNSSAVRQRIEANPLFQRLPAVARGSYVPLDLPTAIAIGFPFALSIPYALQQSVPKIAAALAR